MAEKNVVIKDYEFFILPVKEEDGNNVEKTKIFIEYVNQKPLSELISIYLVDRVAAIMEISKMVQKEDAKAKAKECLEKSLKDVVAFDSEFKQRIQVRLQNFGTS